MPLRGSSRIRLRASSNGWNFNRRPWMLVALVCVGLASLASGMKPARLAELRHDTVDMFYHGFDNYMNVAFPEDELAPVSCVPLTRDPHNPNNLELNDVLGNYSLTLIDSLSTLAILASAPPDKVGTAKRALRDFQDGVAALVVEYGDGSDGPAAQGARGRGFDVDSKVQVFETVIRGVGGLLSAHLFAIGELPINGYEPEVLEPSPTRGGDDELLFVDPILWPNDLVYNGQMLRLALDLAQRLLPAFYSTTGMPYPRVNLRHGIPFYSNSPLNKDADGDCEQDRLETTETCSAGAGSLVLEFTVLSRLTGDVRFESLAKRAFWAVWARRSEINLIGAGIDAEGGHWIGPFAGIGAGTDSFFEYALKTHILTSGLALPNSTSPHRKTSEGWLDPNTLYRELTVEENSPDSFLWAWKEAHDAIKRHIYSKNHHPHYVNVHLGTGSPQIFWVDSLGAYYPGLLALAGELEEAVETNLLYTALWTRYAALPERWSVRDRNVEMKWWPLRPEFIESNYHLYRATKDPWYLHVGEMVLSDIKQRCWTPCGWSGLQDVLTGKLSDRMQSFFLGETAKYLYLLFDADHPLNQLDAPYVFTTEGHPLVIPRKNRQQANPPKAKTTENVVQPFSFAVNEEVCPVPPAQLPFGMSPTAGRADIFHAAHLTGLQETPNLRPHVHRSIIHTEIAAAEGKIITNHTIYPWTLPTGLIALDATSGILPVRPSFSIQFPADVHTPHQGFKLLPGQGGGIVRIQGQGLLVKSMLGLKFELEEDDALIYSFDSRPPITTVWRITSLGRIALGRDERVFITRDMLGPVIDPSFTRVKDPVELDLVIQLENQTISELSEVVNEPSSEYSSLLQSQDELRSRFSLDQAATFFEGRSADFISKYSSRMLSTLLSGVTSVLQNPLETLIPLPQHQPGYQLVSIPALAPAGPGAAPLPSVPDAPLPDPKHLHSGRLTWGSVYFAPGDSTGCTPLPLEAVQTHQILVLRRGGCTFSAKLSNIPAFDPVKRSLKLVIVVDFDEITDAEGNKKGPIRPLLDEVQKTPGGLRRVEELPMVAVGGGEATWEVLRRARGVGVRRRYWVESVKGLRIGNLVVV